MQDPAQVRPLRGGFQQLYSGVPRRRFWAVIAGGLGLGIAFAVPLTALILFHEGPWTGFLWDLLFRLPFLLLVLFLLVEVSRSLRTGKLKEAMKGLLVLIFFGLLTSWAWFQFVRHVQSVVHFRQLQPRKVIEVGVGCHATADANVVEQIMTDLRGVQWYSPDSHGWSPYAELTLKFADGHSEYYSLTHTLAEGRLVVRWNGSNAILVAVPHLADSMEHAGLLRVASFPRYDNKGFYQAIVPPSVCKQGQIRDN
jgi:hypothetical protein